MNTRALFIVAILSLAGCMSMPADPSKMDAQQLKAMAADNKGIAYCGMAQNAGGNIYFVSANLDMVPKTGGSVIIEGQCKTTIIAAPVAASTPK